MKSEIKPTLAKGRNYQIKGYPKSDIQLTARYLGNGVLEGFGENHVFVEEEKDNRTYVFMNDHWLREIDGFLTYSPISSSSLLFITSKQIKELPEPSKLDRRKISLINLLNSLGESL